MWPLLQWACPAGGRPEDQQCIASHDQSGGNPSRWAGRQEEKELEKELEFEQVDDLQKDINRIDDLMKQAPDRIILGKSDDDKNNEEEK